MTFSCVDCKHKLVVKYLLRPKCGWVSYKKYRAPPGTWLCKATIYKVDLVTGRPFYWLCEDVRPNCNNYVQKQGIIQWLSNLANYTSNSKI